jgi:hypothetical protein
MYFATNPPKRLTASARFPYDSLLLRRASEGPRGFSEPLQQTVTPAPLVPPSQRRPRAPTALSLYLNLEKPKLELAARCDRSRMAGTIKIGTNFNFIDGTDRHRRYRYPAAVGP